MSVIWLSPRLPADRSALASTLGPDVEISTDAYPPVGASLAVATVYERTLLERFARRRAGSLLLLKPPGTATPAELPAVGTGATVTEAADVAAAADAIRRVLEGPVVPWPEPEDAGAAPGGWLLAGTGESPTGELPTAAAGVPAAAPVRGRHTRRNWVASGGIIGVAALAAVVVLATQGGASGTSNTGFRGPGGNASGGYGFGGPGGFGGFGSPNGSGSSGGSSGSGGGTATSPNGSAPGSAARAAERKAFLDCLTKNGVDTSSLGSGRRLRLDPSDPTIATALQKCRTLLPERGLRGGFRPGGEAPDGTAPGGTPPAGMLPPGTGQNGTGRTT